MWNDFRDFINKGNVIELAVGLILATTFAAVVKSLVDDIIMPPIGLLLGGVDFSNLFVALDGQPYASLAEADAAGAPTINYGLFINNIITFLIVAFVVFLIARAYNRMQTQKAEATTKDCPYCFSTIPVAATRCANCTSELSVAA
jgi:large conductance mechanosensitive channel